MSTINTTINIQNQSTGIMFPINQSRVTDQEGFSVSQITVGAVEEQVTSEYLSPRQVTLRLLSGSDVKVGVHLGASGGVYPLRLSGANEAMVLRLDVEGLRETQTIVVTSENANTTLHEKSFSLEGSSGTWCVWFDIDGTGEIPDGTTDAALEITGIAASATIAAVGAAIYAQMLASTAFMADFTVAYASATNTLTLTDRHTGTRANIADGTNTTGFTFNTTQAGAASPGVFLLSTGTSQVVVGVVPN